MKIFVSHSSRDKALVREVKERLPSFLKIWLDEESLCWGDSFPAQLKSTIQSGIDCLLIFLNKEVPSRKSLISLRDELTTGQAKLLGYLVEKGKDGGEIAQRQIEQGLGYSHASAELYYRLESLIQQGFVTNVG